MGKAQRVGHRNVRFSLKLLMFFADLISLYYVMYFLLLFTFRHAIVLNNVKVELPQSSPVDPRHATRSM